MKVEFFKSKVIWNNTEYPIEIFSKRKMLIDIIDNTNSIKQKAYIIAMCIDKYLPISKEVALKHHRGCRYAVSHRDSKDTEYKMYKSILLCAKKLNMELDFERKVGMQC